MSLYPELDKRIFEAIQQIIDEANREAEMAKAAIDRCISAVNRAFPGGSMEVDQGEFNRMLRGVGEKLN